MPRPKTSSLTAREAEIMEILWSERAATAEQVRRRLAGSPHDSTVRTLLRLMEEKELVAHDVEQRTYVYRPLIARSKARRKALRALLSQFFEGSVSSLVLQLLDDEQITAGELERLAREAQPTPGKTRKRGRK